MCGSKSSHIECYLPLHWKWQHQWFSSSCRGPSQHWASSLHWTTSIPASHLYHFQQCHGCHHAEWACEEWPWSHPPTSHLQVWCCLLLEMEYLIFHKEASPDSRCDTTHHTPGSIVVYPYQVDMAFCNDGMHGLIPVNMSTEWQWCTKTEKITCQNVINIEFSFGPSNLHHLSLFDVHLPSHVHVCWSNRLQKGGPLIKLDDLFSA